MYGLNVATSDCDYLAIYASNTLDLVASLKCRVFYLVLLGGCLTNCACTCSCTD
jgi:hypothetical protein